MRLIWTLALLLAAPAVAQAETLTAQQALSRAARQNPTLRAALLDVAAAQQGVEAERGARDPVFVASVTGGYTETAGASATGAGIASERSLASSAAVRYTTEVGTQLEVGTTGDVSWRTPSAALDSGPRYGALAYVSARQPLLRGAGRDGQLAPERAAVASARAAELSRDATASQLALDVVSAYWELWYAEQAVLVQQKALETAKKQLSDAQIREGQLGTASKADVLQFLSNVASIEDALSQAVTVRETRAFELGRLLGMAPPNAGALNAGGDLPALEPPAPSAALFEQAVVSSPELAALRAELDAQRAELGAAEDADQPRLDVFATASTGLAWSDPGSGFNLAGGRPAYSVVGGLELELPLGGGRAKAEAARSRLRLDAAHARYQERWLAVTSQVGALRASVEAARQQSELAAQSARVARELAEAERHRLLLGTTTSADVVLVEQSLRAAELRALRVRVTRVVAQYQLEHVTGRLLPRFGSLFEGRSS